MQKIRKTRNLTAYNPRQMNVLQALFDGISFSEADFHPEIKPVLSSPPTSSEIKPLQQRNRNEITENPLKLKKRGCFSLKLQGFEENYPFETEKISFKSQKTAEERGVPEIKEFSLEN